MAQTDIGNASLGIGSLFDSPSHRANRTIYSLAQVCRRLGSGKSIKAGDLHSTGSYPVYGANGIRGYTSTFNFQGECAVIGRQGVYCGNVHYCSGEAYMSEHAIIAQPCDLANARYLAYLLGLMNLARLQGQSAQPGLSVQTLAKEKIILPDLAEQKRVASLIGTIDDKIALNRKLNHNLALLAA